MKYEEPKLNILILNTMDVIKTSNTPGKEWVGDNDDWVELD